MVLKDAKAPFGRRVGLHRMLKKFRFGFSVGGRSF
jgi:hypothetical protein